MRIRTALIAGALACVASTSAAFALSNPLVAQLAATGGSRLTGNVTFMQLGGNVDVGVDLNRDVTNAAVDVRSGSCANPAKALRYPLVAVNGTTQETRLGVSLQQLVGNIVVVHKTSSTSSPVVACGAIKG